ncbi:glycosyltransferase family 4 protein [Rathayibacter sp. VKM Ac-2754]|uniref:glycosyltransferase family 4 protein n=1 Tax=Rathayibacter sp. VKM Ac-2754 TaxID=2609251 RepID=UPI00135A6642|nr:glycosyltransferase family 4 protein [Rathayibacter sp. VKM Ac-2754]MWV60589.1 glycosyltransferase [Rathayibacter sp. VKM Ac-2754]
MTGAPRVLLLALPLMARSGVYRSTHDLVRAARAAGLPWSAVVGVRPTASGEPIETEGVREVAVAAHGRRVVDEIEQVIRDAGEVSEADLIVSMISQTDIALARRKSTLGQPWVAWVRGIPWPDKGEQSFARRLLLRVLETRALRAADEVWATTPVLAQQFASAAEAKIVPAGIASTERISHGENGHSPLVWAGRIDVDKRPQLFLQIVELLQTRARVFGEGPLLRSIEADAPDGVEWRGWVEGGRLWTDASLFVGTSAREAFGRSAVEAACAGLPVVISSAYGAAPLLFTDPALKAACVIDSDEPGVWAAAIRRLLTDVSLRSAVSEHVHRNAMSLTIERSVLRAAEEAAGILAGREDRA